MEEDDRELQLLPMPGIKHRSSTSSSRHNNTASGPSLELQLCSYGYETCVERLKWEAAEQIRLAALEKGYAERVRELARREMELAQSEFASARNVCERARREVEMSQRFKDTATHDPPTITCHSCRRKFRPT